ncbi:MAG: ribonuclease Z [Bacteroidota bacterium]
MVFEVKILGCNSASFAYGRHHTAQIVNHDHRYFLVDCGEGTQIQMIKQKVKLARISHIFISHLHGDHYLGLMGLLSTMHLQGRQSELHIYAFPGLDEILTLQMKVSAMVTAYTIHFHALEHTRSLIYENDHLCIETIPLDHSLPTNGFLFREKGGKRKVISEKIVPGMQPRHIGMLKRGEDVVDESGNVLHSWKELTHPPAIARSYAFCSDTRYNESIIPQIEGVDLLYHESTFLEEMESRAAQTFHSTARHAALIALKANVKQLMLGHFSSRYRETDVFLEEAKTVFVNTLLSREGHSFPVGIQPGED